MSLAPCAGRPDFGHRADIGAIAILDARCLHGKGVELCLRRKSAFGSSPAKYAALSLEPLLILDLDLDESSSSFEIFATIANCALLAAPWSGSGWLAK